MFITPKFGLLSPAFPLGLRPPWPMMTADGSTMGLKLGSRCFFFSSILFVTCVSTHHVLPDHPAMFLESHPCPPDIQVTLLSGTHQLLLDTIMTLSYGRSSRAWNRIHTEDQTLNIQATLGKEFPIDCHTQAQVISLTTAIRSWQSLDPILSILRTSVFLNDSTPSHYTIRTVPRCPLNTRFN